MRQSVPSFICRIAISGEAGDGIMSAGDILMKAAAREGFDVAVAKSFPSNIRGGYSRSLVTIAEKPVVSPIGDCAVICALSSNAFLRDTPCLSPRTLVLVETNAHADGVCRDRFDRLIAAGLTVFSVPVLRLARETAGNSVVKSTVALGILGGLLALGSASLRSATAERFGEKGAELIELNRIALDAGFRWVRRHIDRKHRLPVPARRAGYARKERFVLEGNQAVALGAIAAGCTFFASYPITPATAVGEALSHLMPACGGIAYQAEDEIAALGAAIGASFTGAKAMTATSGPGLSLMQEFLGYASMAELPVVVVDVQRAGPSTGMPTNHGQEDLLAAIFGSHGETQRIVIAPATVEECFSATVTAFNCAERYQCPVIVLSDGTLGMTGKTVAKSALKSPRVVNRKVFIGKDDKRWLRYRLTDSGISPLTIPGLSSVTYRATGIEHNEDATPAATPSERCAQNAKRCNKLRHIETEFDNPVLWDLEPANDAPLDAGICAWGLTALIAREAVVSLRKEGFRIAAVYPRLLFPVCIEAFNRWADLCELQIVVEANVTGQFCSLLRMNTRARPRSLTVSRGEPFTPSEITACIRSIITGERAG
ncbi:MAG: 2-oxoacid:acceptor oxidoreductase subunit alpha [Chitinispirillaceae bacterium]|nr:2-oxoacid:acceptor oxidoreductase subunit alpha [Chitinispirillaceae bacterium]